MSKKKAPKRSEQAAYSLAKRGQKALERGDYEAAITDLETAYDPALEGSLPGRIQQALAETHFRCGQRYFYEDAAQALVNLQRAAELQPQDALYAYHVGLAQHRLGDLTEAIAGYKEALRRDPAFDRPRLPLAIAHQEHGDTLNKQQQALLNQQDAGTPLAQGLACAAAGDWATAETVLQDALDTGQTPLAQGLAHYYLGVVAAQKDDIQQAIGHWQAAQEAGYDSAHLERNLGLAVARQAHMALAAGQAEQSVAWMQTGQTETPISDGIAAQARLNAGYACATQGKWEQALEHWQGIAEPTAEQARALAANTAIAYEKLKRWQEAADAWRDFARRRPRKQSTAGWLTDDQVAQLWARVALLYYKADEIGEAIQTLQNALKYQPNDPVLLLELARYFLEQDSYDAAENQIDKVLKKNPRHAEALVLKAELAELRPGWFGQIPGVKQWEQVAALNDEAHAPLARERLGRLYGMKAVEQMAWNLKAAVKAARKGLEYAPENSILRGLLINLLLRQEVDWAEIEAEIEQSDLSDQDMLHQFVDGLHRDGYHDRVADLLERADATRPLDAAFFLGVADCAFGREQPDIAEKYLQEALARAKPGQERQRIRVDVGELYWLDDQREKAEALWAEVRREDPRFGPLLYVQGMQAFTRAEYFIADRYLKKAEAWAEKHRDRALLEKVQKAKEMIRGEAYLDYWDDDEEWD